MLSDKEEVLPACAVGVKPGHQDQVVHDHREDRHRRRHLLRAQLPLRGACMPLMDVVAAK